MGLHRRSIRLRIFLLVLIPILSLIGLYAFAVSITASDAINLARSKTVKNTIGLPTGQLEAQVDAERIIAVVYLASPNPLTLAALHAQELKTGTALSAFSRAVGSPATMGSASTQEKQAFATLLNAMAGLATLHSQITSLAISRPQAVNAYSRIITAADGALNQVILQQTNVPLATQGLAFVNMGKSEEMLLQEDALVLGDLAARSFHVTDRQQFTELVGARRALYAQTLPDLDPVYRAYYQKDVSPQSSAALAALEDGVINDPRPRLIPPVAPAAWNRAVGAVSAGLSQAGDQAANELTLRAQPVANATYRRLILAGSLGLAAIIASIIMSLWIGRGLVRQLADLKKAALELAHERLPSLVQRLRAGQDVDVSAEAPALESSSDEIGQVREAFNAVQRTAVEAAVDEARVRRGISDVFRNLARRSQSLLHRQLALLDAMERRATEPGELEDLFRIDHLTTRMRRHSEGLIILSGESPGRGWRNPVPLADVLRAAVAEVEDYTRIRVTTGTRAALVGSAVADVIHLLAELAENATIFSPPNTPVRIHGDIVGRGFAVDIEDRGLGIPEEKMAEINHNLAHPPPFDLSGSDQLGLFIAGQLARRHKIQISLRPSPYGGTNAIVLIPKSLIVDEESYDLQPGAAEHAIRLTGRHAGLQSGIGAELAALAQPTALTSPAVQPAGPAAVAPPTVSVGAPTAVADRPAADLPPAPAAEPAAEPAADPSGEPAFDPWVIPVGRAAAPSRSSASPAGEFAAFSGVETAVAAGGSVTNGGDRRAGEPGGSADQDPGVTTAELTELGLPVRVRQASLAPQLRGQGAAAAAADQPPGPSPEAARSTFAALQRGWERGRSESGGADPAATALGPEPGDDTQTERPDA
jgi:signal transduction histidine kinase